MRRTLSLGLVLLLSIVALSFLPSAPTGHANGITGVGPIGSERVSGSVPTILLSILGVDKLSPSLSNWTTVLSPPTVAISSPATNAIFIAGSTVVAECQRCGPGWHGQ